MPTDNNKRTADCQKVWDLIAKVGSLDEDLGQQLSDAFCNFECSWDQHCEEFH